MWSETLRNEGKMPSSRPSFEAILSFVKPSLRLDGN